MSCRLCISSVFVFEDTSSTIWPVPRAAVSIVLSPEQEEELRERLEDPSVSGAAALRARIVLRAAAGETNGRIAGALGVSETAVGLWRRRFAREGVAGLADRPRSGRPRTLSKERVERALALRSGPPVVGVSRWSVRRVAAETGISAASVQRLWQEEREGSEEAQGTCERPTPALAARCVEAVGLYLNWPEAALVLAITGGTRATGVMGDRGLAAAMAAPAGHLVRRRRSRAAHEELLSFLRRALRAFPTGELCLLLAPSPANSAPELARFLARAKSRRLRFHQSLSRDAWVELVGSWCWILAADSDRDADELAVGGLVGVIERLYGEPDGQFRPFVWLKSPGERR